MSSLADLSALLLDLCRESRHTERQDLRAWALQRLQALIAFDAAVWTQFRVPNGQLELHAIHLHARPGTLLTEWLALGLGDVLLRAIAPHGQQTSGAGRVSALSSPALSACAGRWQLDEMLWVTGPPDAAGWRTAIVLFREPAPGDQDRAFSQGERSLLEHSHPQLVEAYRVNQLLTLVRAARSSGKDALAWALADCAGSLEVGPPEAVALLQAEWPGWNGPLLPAPLLAPVRSGAAQRHLGKRIVVLIRPSASGILLGLRERCPADALTPREAQIVDGIARGLSAKAIALELGISPLTVRSHTTTLFAKFGVKRQAQLVSLLGRSAMDRPQLPGPTTDPMALAFPGTGGSGDPVKPE